MTLPLLINKRNRIFIGFLWAAVFVTGYLIPNHFHLSEPKLLPMTWIDLVTPFEPWTVLVYTSEYYMFVLGYLLLSSDYNRDRYMWAFFGVTVISAVVFVFYPTTFPRADYPIPPDTHWFVYRVFSNLRSVDTPSNAFPSMHVCCCYLTVFAFLPREESRWKFWWFLAWTTAVAVSTLTTKQHYLADLIAGLVEAVVGYWIFFKWTRYVPVTDYLKILFGKGSGAPSAK